MPNSHLSRFNALILEKKSFKEALVQTHKEYLAELLKASKKLRSRIKKRLDEKLRRTLRGFRKHIESAEIGNLAIGYEFKIALPSTFEEFLNFIKLKEQNIMQTPSPLVQACQIKMAQEEHSPQVIYAQLFKLEHALKEDQVPNYHREEVLMTISELEEKLYEKFASLILQSSNIDELELKMQEAFPLAVTDELPDSKLAFFKHESDSQVEYLSENKFLSCFYELKTLAQKYEFTFNYYQNLKAQSKLTVELRATLSHLFYLIVQEAYAPCEAEKFKLMRENGASIEEVFAALKEWTKINWEKHKEYDFVNHLEDILNLEYNEYCAWIDVRIFEGDIDASQKPMYHFFSRVKYQRDEANPHDLLKTIASPLKPKPSASASVIASAETPVSLHTDEELGEDNDDNVLNEAPRSFCR